MKLVYLQGYGLTESTAVGTRGLNTEKFQKYSSIGLLAPNIEAKVVDWITGALLPPGESGELWIRGPGVMKGDKFYTLFNRFKFLRCQKCI
jgi:4-coumarate--CoA ligase